MIYYFSLTLIVTFLGLMIFHIIGDFIQKKIKKTEVSVFSIPYGFITIVFINFVIGAPMQILHRSWIEYAIIFSLVVGILFLVSVKQYPFSKITRSKIVEHFKYYWFVYIAVGIHFLINISGNVHVFLAGHGDDSYYLARIVKNIGNENLQSIQPVLANGILPNQDGMLRQFETFELLISYISIYIPAPTIVAVRFIISPLILSVIYTTFLLLNDTIWSKKNILFQYICFIPLIVALHGIVFIDSTSFFYNQTEQWKMNFTLYYGGTFVQFVGATIFFIIFYKALIKKFTPLSFYIQIVIAGFALMSFSSQVLPMFVLMNIAFTLFFVLMFFKEKAKFVFGITNIVLSIITGIFFFFINYFEKTQNVFMTIKQSIIFLFTSQNVAGVYSLQSYLFMNIPLLFSIIGVVIFLVYILVYNRERFYDRDVLISFAPIATMLFLLTLVGKGIVFWFGTYDFIYFRIFNSIIILSFFSLLCLILNKFHVTDRFLKNAKYIAIVCLTLLVVAVPLMRHNVSERLESGYGVSFSAFLLPDKIHPIVRSFNDQVQKDIDMRNLSYTPKGFSMSYVILGNRFLFIESNQQFLAPNLFIDFNSLRRIDNFIDSDDLPDEFNPNLENIITEFRTQVDSLDGKIDMELLNTIYERYGIEYFITYDGKIDDLDQLEIIGSISYEGLPKKLMIFRVR